jgi:RNA polymerase sigma-70 factor (TIGR02960 family)
VTEDTLSRARAGGEDAFRALTDPYRRELHLHCYRMLGSVHDAEDLVQETLLAAWRGLDGFEERSSMRAWLYRIATNRCLNALRDGRRRPSGWQRAPEAVRRAWPRPTHEEGPVWVQPYPDLLAEAVADPDAEPHARYEAREAIGLAFVTALHRLPPLQRAVLVLRDVLGLRAAEVAEMLETTPAAVNSALVRARATLDARLAPGQRDRAPLPGSPTERDLVGRFARAFEDGDIDAVVELLTDDAWLTMPPEPSAYQGPVAIAEFLRSVVALHTRRFRMIPTRANGQPAFGAYAVDPAGGSARAHGLFVLALDGERIAMVTRFLDNGVLAAFALPSDLEA